MPEPPAPTTPPVPMEDPARPTPPLVDPEPPHEPDEPAPRIDEPALPSDDPAGEPVRDPALVHRLGAAPSARDTVPELFPAPPLAAGTRLEGRYTVRGIVGLGACGTVYEVTTAEERALAVKVPHAEPEAEARVAERFAEEIALARLVAHPNLARWVDQGRLADGRPFLVMELVRGESVADRLARGVLPLSEVVRVASGVLDALQALSHRGVVHRDVKPANVLLEGRGRALRAVLVDFGTATRRDGPGATAARRGTSLIGTPDYMAPEQFDGRPVDARTDVYGAAALIYEMLTGSVPRCELSQAGWRSDYVPARASRSDVPRALDGVLDRALSPEPARRYPSAGAFRSALRRAASSRLALLRPVLAVPALAAAAYLLAPIVLDAPELSAQPVPDAPLASERDEHAAADALHAADASAVHAVLAPAALSGAASAPHAKCSALSGEHALPGNVDALALAECEPRQVEVARP